MNTAMGHPLVKNAREIISIKLNRQITIDELQNIISKKLGQTEGGRVLLNNKDLTLKDIKTLRKLFGIKL